MALDRERLLLEYAPRLVQQRAASGPGAPSAMRPDEQVDDGTGDGVDETKHRGVMVAFFLDPEPAAALLMCCDAEGAACKRKEAGQVELEASDELHLTLVYLGRAGDDVREDQLPVLVSTVREWAAAHSPIPAVVSGVGRFNNDEDTSVTYAGIDAPDLSAARQDLVDRLTAAGLPPAGNHGFTPHVTLAYANLGDLDLPRLPLDFAAVTLSYGAQRAHFPMGAQRAAAAGAVRARLAEREPAPSTTGTTASTSSVWNPIVTTTAKRTIITVPATTERAAMWGTPPNPNPHMLWMQGRFVGAERPNRNGAFWSTADLELGRPTVAHGPLNWLHEDRHIIGTIADARFVGGPSGDGARPASPEQYLDAVARGGDDVPAIADPHIAALAAVWRWIYPDEASVVQMASDARVLAYSMECVAEAVQCVRDEMKDIGCGRSFSYLEYSQGRACEHLQARASIRRLVNPTFLGGAVIVPPTRPGWADADARVMRQAAAWAEKAYEQAGRPDIPAATWEQLMAGVVRYAQD